MTVPSPILRFLLDSNVIDALIDRSQYIAFREAVSQGRCRVTITHVQIDELARTPDVERRCQLLVALIALHPEFHQTAGFVLDFSRLGGSSLGDGVTVDAIRGDNVGRSGDALIAATAEGSSFILVTEDGQLRRQADRQLTCPTWSFDDLTTWLLTGSSPNPTLSG
ncbi:MAG: type II toxin-antitoxin system VapC family toxin [Acidimicrobiales bacterium]